MKDVHQKDPAILVDGVSDPDGQRDRQPEIHQVSDDFQIHAQPPRNLNAFKTLAAYAFAVALSSAILNVFINGGGGRAGGPAAVNERGLIWSAVAESLVVGTATPLWIDRLTQRN